MPGVKETPYMELSDVFRHRTIEVEGALGKFFRFVSSCPYAREGGCMTLQEEKKDDKPDSKTS